MKEIHEDVFKTQWRGIEIEITYSPKWTKIGSCDLAHLQIRSISPPEAPLPITRTGYRSHFFYTAKSPSKAEVLKIVADWMDEEAQNEAWKILDAENKQMNLF